MVPLNCYQVIWESLTVTMFLNAAPLKYIGISQDLIDKAVVEISCTNYLFIFLTTKRRIKYATKPRKKGTTISVLPGL